MPIIGDAAVVVDADTGPFDRTLKRDVPNAVSGVGTLIKGIIGAQVVTQGARAAVDLLKGSVAEAREANAVAAQTAAAIKSTGGAANVSAKEVNDLADAIARKTGIDDEQIAKASNLLLTFTGVRNEVGKGNDIFNQATKIAVDMGKALGTDAAGSAIQLGKALNDPLKGITALTRVGVTFTDQQKAQIKNFQDQGKVAEAQKVILAELNKEFGGSAEAGATASARLGVTIGNIKESLGNQLIPIIDTAATFLADRLPGAIDFLTTAFNNIKETVSPFIDTFVLGLDALKSAFEEGDVTSDGFVGTMEQIGVTLRDLYENAFKPTVAFIQDNLKPILIGLGAAFLVLTGPITFLASAFVIAYTKSETFRDVVQAVVGKVVDIIGGLVEFVQTNLPKFQEAFDHVVNAVRIIFETVFPIIKPIVEGVINTVVAIIERVISVIKNVVLFVTNIINGDFKAAFGNLTKIVGDIIGAVIDIFKNLGPKIFEALAGLTDKMLEFGGQLIQGLLDGIAKGAKGIGAFIKRNVVDKIKGAITNPFGIFSPSKLFDGYGRNMMEGLANGIRAGANLPTNAMNASTSGLAPAGTSPNGTTNQRAVAGSQYSFGDIKVYESQANPEVTAFAVMSRIAAELNL